MRTTIMAACLMALAATAVAETTKTQMQMPEMPKPQKEHEWLKQLEGEWEYEAEMAPMEAGKPAMKSKGTETVKAIGGFWAVSENKGDFMGSPFSGILTLGYSPEKSKYVGSWVDSMQPRLWTYEGTVDSGGKKLTLHAEGPCPMQPGKIVKFEESLEITGADSKTFVSKVDMDGKMETMMTINYKRKK